jgi:membrane protease YdiL (CAAX protease family)
MREIFWNRFEHRLRAGWRVLIQIVIVSVPLSVLALMGIFTSREMTDTKVMITALPITIISVLFLGRFIDKRKFSDYGIHLKDGKWWAEYGVGFIVGFLSACLLVGVLVIIGAAEIKLANKFVSDGRLLISTSLISVVTYAGVGIFEEILRVYQIRNISEGLTKTKLGVIGAMFVGIFFAGLYSVIMHIASQDLIFLIFVLISALIYGLYYLFTNRTAIAIAQHFSWDLTISFIFLLGGSSVEEPAIFLVPIKQIPSIDSSTLLPVVGLIVRFIGLICVVFWIKRREGAIQFHREISEPSLLKK